MSALAWRREHLSQVDSTNRALLERARLGASEGLVLWASFQSQGRGRLGRAWLAPPDSALLCSILLRPALEPGEMQWAVIAVALAARAALAGLGAECSLKWPNDLVVGTLKLGGVLAESVPGVPGAVVVGLGLNLTSHPPELAATDVATLIASSPPGPDALLDTLLEQLEPRRALLASPAGRARLLHEYRAGLATIGQEVSVQQREETWHGQAVDVDDAGCLLVQTGQGVRRVLAGDVVHLRRSGS